MIEKRKKQKANLIFDFILLFWKEDNNNDKFFI